MNSNGFQCIRCHEKLAADFSAYHCPTCGGNLDVLYDYSAIQKKLINNTFRQGSRYDMFDFNLLLPVDVSNAPPLRIGSTPLYHAKRLGKELCMEQVFIKDDGLNPSGSFKDRASAVALAQARESGEEVIAGASTGNAGSSMACIAASVGMPCVVFVPENAPAAKITQLLVFGAKVLAVRGSYDDAFDLCFKVCQEKGWFNRNTGFNPYTREGKKTCAFEICEQLDWNPPDRVLVPTGDGNIISGIWKGFKELRKVGLIDRLPKIDAIQSSGSAAVVNATKKLRSDSTPKDIHWEGFNLDPVNADTVADSISVNLPRDGIAATRAVIESGGEAFAVSDEVILSAIPELAQHTGVFVEPAAAASWAGLKRMVHEHLILPNERVVCLCTGNGLKDIDSARIAAGNPLIIDATLESAMQALKDVS